MPIEIKELIIRTTIHESPQENSNPDEKRMVFTEDFMQECVENILKIIDKKQER